VSDSDINWGEAALENSVEGLIFDADAETVSGAWTFSASPTIGAAAAGVDYTLTFAGEDATNTITMDEDNDVWNFGTASAIFTDDVNTFEMADGTYAADAVGPVRVNGELTGKTKITVDTNDAVVLASTDCYGEIWINGDDDAQDYTLPAASKGLTVTFANALYAQVITVDASAGDKIILNDGTALAAANAADSSGAADDKGTFVAIDGEYWMIFSEQNAWTDGGAD